jgi:hypothetical protein
MNSDQSCNPFSRKISCITLWVALSLFVFPSVLIADQFKATGTIDAYFSPCGGATETIVNEINSKVRSWFKEACNV